MIVENSFATDDSGCVSGPREVENLHGRAFRIAWDTRGACLQHAEVSHAPFGRVAADEHHAVAMLNAFARKKSSDARREFAQVGIGVLLLAPISLDTHRDTSRVALGRSLK